jgi:hypothetical protein
MEKSIFKFIKPILILTLIILFFACKNGIFEERTFMANVPKYLSYEELRSAVKSVDEQTLVNPGKIYFKDNYLFINDIFKGIHIIDNSDVSNPEIIAFIEIPGNIDIAIKDNILFADSYIDLVAIDISDFSNIHEVARIEEIFIYAMPEYDWEYPLAQIDDQKGVIVDWETKEVTETQEVDGNWFGGKEIMLMDATEANYSGGGDNQASVGVAGSMARFTIFENYLYTINQSDILLVAIDEPTNPMSETKVAVERDIETLFVLEDKLFIGSTTGMIIYDLQNAASPSFISEITHFTSCDPVVVAGDYAYVTLHSGNRCGGFSNQLDVINISDLYMPVLEETYEMYNPFGLGIDNGTLFICDGDAGLKIYDASNPPYEIDQHLIASYPGINAYDIIPYNNIAMMIGEDGLYQYDYSELDSLVLLSEILVD